MTTPFVFEDLVPRSRRRTRSFEDLIPDPTPDSDPLAPMAPVAADETRAGRIDRDALNAPDPWELTAFRDLIETPIEDTRINAATRDMLARGPQLERAGDAVSPNIPITQADLDRNPVVAGATTGFAGDLSRQLGNMAQILGLDEAGERMIRRGEWVAAKNPPRVPSLGDIGDVEDVGDYAGYQLGRGLASTVPSLAAATAATAAGGGVPLALGAAALPSYVQNVGDIREELGQQGAEGISRDLIALSLGLPVAALDVLTPTRAAGVAAGGVAGAAARGLRPSLGRIGREAGIEAGQEAVTEATQEGIQYAGVQAATGNRFDWGEFTPRVLEAGVAGGLTGGAMGGGVQATTEGVDALGRMQSPPPSPLDLGPTPIEPAPATPPAPVRETPPPVSQPSVSRETVGSDVVDAPIAPVAEAEPAPTGPFEDLVPVNRFEEPAVEQAAAPPVLTEVPPPPPLDEPIEEERPASVEHWNDHNLIKEFVDTQALANPRTRTRHLPKLSALYRELQRRGFSDEDILRQYVEIERSWGRDDETINRAIGRVEEFLVGEQRKRVAGPSGDTVTESQVPTSDVGEPEGSVSGGHEPDLATSPDYYARRGEMEASVAEDVAREVKELGHREIATLVHEAEAATYKGSRFGKETDEVRETRDRAVARLSTLREEHRGALSHRLADFLTVAKDVPRTFESQREAIAVAKDADEVARIHLPHKAAGPLASLVPALEEKGFVTDQEILGALGGEYTGWGQGGGTLETGWSYWVKPGKDPKYILSRDGEKKTYKGKQLVRLIRETLGLPSSKPAEQAAPAPEPTVSEPAPADVPSMEAPAPEAPADPIEERLERIEAAAERLTQAAERLEEAREPIQPGVRADAEGSEAGGVRAPDGERGTPGAPRGSREARPDAVGGEPGGTPAPVPGAQEPLPEGAAPGEPEVDGGRDRVPRNPEPARGRGTDYVLSPDTKLGAGGPLTRAKRNIAAIRLLKQVEAEGRNATPAEQDVLVQYVGWGGLPQIFDKPGEWAGPRGELEALLTRDELAAARTSTLNAHYTALPVIRGLFDALTHLGVDGGRFLEPSMGIGHFLGLTPPDTRWVGVEKDNITGRIGALLYPRQDVRVQGFEESRLADGSFDVAVGNVPFGDYRLTDKRYDKLKFLIHDYFFAKALDLVRPGGLVAFITSKGTLDKLDPKVRKYLAERADLLGAIRLPNTAFKANANTEVTTDILFLQRRAEGAAPSAETWTGLAALTNSRGETIKVNEYFVRHPEMMLGEMQLAGTMRRANEPALIAPEGQDLGAALAAAIATLPRQVYTPAEPDAPGTRTPELPEQDVPPSLLDGSYYLSGDTLLQRVAGKAEVAKVPKTQREKVKQLVGLRDARRALVDAELADLPDAAIAARRKALNRLYDAFVKAHGPINQEVRQETKRLDKEGQPVTQYRYPNLSAFDDDPQWQLVAALEHYDAESGAVSKADILERRVLNRRERVDVVASAHDALPIVLADRGRVDLEMIAHLAKLTPEQAVEQLEGRIYEDPATGEWQEADQYLSGDVRQKLRAAEAAAKKEPRFANNARALREVQPEDLPPSKIRVRLGATWVPAQDITDFVNAVVGERGAEVVYVPVVGSWKVRIPNWWLNNPVVWQEYGTQRANLKDLLDDALNLRTPTVYDTTSDGAKVVNPKETLAAQDKLEKLQQRFEQWIWEDGHRAERLARLYNDRFNSIRLPQPDGSHLTLPGMTATRRGDPFALLPHQKNAIWRIVRDRKALLAHVVGAGKTYTMVGAGMEMKRLGLARKPLYVVPNHMLHQFSREFAEMYPNARLLVATKDDFAKDERKTFVARMASNDWDAIIMTHRSFEAVPMSAEYQIRMLREQLDTLEDAIVEAKRERGGDTARSIVKEIESARQKLKKRLESLLAEEKKDEGLTFEETGVDYLFVDEAHLFKNLYFPTKMRNIGGASSERAFDLYMKALYLDEVTGGGGLTFATGTPIANSIAEMFTMQRFLQPRLLKERGLAMFDAWASTFATPETAYELNITGSGFRQKTRLARFQNVPELVAMFRLVADVQTQEMLKLPIPKMRGGKPEAVIAPGTPGHKAYIQYLDKRAEAVRAKKVDPSEDNYLKITVDGRHAALDLRLVRASAEDTPSSKLARAADRIHGIWQETAAHKGAQLVFLDLSAPGSDSSASRGGLPGFNAYDDLRAKLLERGIPAGDIAFIHSANSDEKKAKLFKALREGRVRVLLGSTEKMGAGTNVQDRLVALHHLDVPWRPADVEQREGRILRQGNLLLKSGAIDAVSILRYATEGTFDAFMWQTVERKARAIGQVMTGDASIRELDDIDESTLNASQMKALASGNPKVMERETLVMEVMKFSRLEANYKDEQFALRKQLVTLPAAIEASRERAESAERDAKTLTPVEGDAFTITVQGKAYTERKAAGEALVGALKAVWADIATQGAVSAGELPPRRLGTFAGLAIEVQPVNGILPKAEMGLVGAAAYMRTIEPADTPLGLVQGLAMTVNRVERVAKDAREDITRAEHKLAKARERSAAPFEHATKLSAARGRLAALEAELAKEGEKKPEPTPPPDEEPDGVTVYGISDPVSAALALATELRKRKAKRDRASRPLAESLDPEVEERFQAAKGLPTPTLGQRMAHAMRELAKTRRHFVELDPRASETMARANDLLLEVEHAPAWAATVARDGIRSVVAPLTPGEVDTFTRLLVLPDILKDVEKGLYEGKELPFGYADADALRADLARFEQASTPAVDRALERRGDFAHDLTTQLVERRLLPKAVLDDERYYHRQVLEHVELLATGLGQRDVRVHRKGFQQQRVGGGDFNTRYQEAEFEWVSQAVRLIHLHDALEELRAIADVSHVLKAQAKQENEARFQQYLADEGIPEDPRDQWRQRLGRATSELYELMEKGELPLKGFEGLGADFAEARAEWEQANSGKSRADRDPFLFQHPQWWDFLRHLIATGDEGAVQAASIFKAVRERERIVEDALGTRYVEWEDLVPEGYRAWQPVRGNYFFPALTIAERAAQDILAGERRLADDDLEQAFVLGGPRETWVVPDGLAATMDRFGVERAEGPIDKAWTRLLGYVKTWFLLSPRRLFTYNFNNLSGDFDGTFLYPGIQRHTPRAAADLWKYMILRSADAELTAEMQEALRRRVLDSGITLTEIPDLNTLPEFERLREADPIGFMKLVGTYFRHARLLTTWRENMLRLAAYRYFQERIRNGDLALGASDPRLLRAQKDPKDRAAMLARDLVGDYGNISTAGTFVRQRMILFYSWLEVNAKRYFWLFRNIPQEGAGAGRAAKVGAALGARVAIGTALRAAWVAAAVHVLFALTAAWNHLFFADEEDELRKQGRRLHVILGRRKDGSIVAVRIEGAWADLLKWVGLEDWPTDLREVATGAATLGDKMVDAMKAPVERVVNAMEPITKTMLELASGRTFFPSVFTPRPIRDKAEYLTRLAQVEWLYQKVTDKPLPPNRPLGALLPVLQTDTGEAAYYHIRDKAGRFLEQQGKGGGGVPNPTARDNALYYWRKSLAWGEAQRAERWRQRFYALGGTPAGLKASLRRASPLGFMSVIDRARFVRGLTDEDRAALAMAEEWYRGWLGTLKESREAAGAR